MHRRLRLFRLPAWAQDLLLALFITVMQVQGTVTRTMANPMRCCGHCPTSGSWDTAC